MPYVRRSDGRRVSPEEVQLMGMLVGLTIPPEDLAALADELSDQLASVYQLAALDLESVDPVLSFDPRWPDQDRGTR
ncbi:MAG TPA: hypothetical protein VFE42_36325 [Chloroflexota bacterium]|nr:hypothetical protein [Chloroflexota bacterium]